MRMNESSLITLVRETRALGHEIRMTILQFENEQLLKELKEIKQELEELRKKLNE